MNKIIYLYILEGMAEWEISYILQGISMQSMFAKSEKERVKYVVKTVSTDKTPIRTIGELTITPDCTLHEIDEANIVALLLPGAETWQNEENNKVLEMAKTYLKQGVLVGAICGSTLALANLEILNTFKHTSNSIDYLKMFSKPYDGEELYLQSQSLVDRNLITASSAGGLLWAKHILEYLDIYPSEVIDSWYKYYLTGDPKFYSELLSNIL